MKWAAPYIHNLITSAAFLVALGLLAALWPVGISVQIYNLLLAHIRSLAHESRSVPPTDRFGFLAAMGVYYLIALPFWIIQLPFALLGRLATRDEDY